MGSSFFNTLIKIHGNGIQNSQCKWYTKKGELDKEGI